MTIQKISTQQIDASTSANGQVLTSNGTVVYWANTGSGTGSGTLRFGLVDNSNTNSSVVNVVNNVYFSANTGFKIEQIDVSTIKVSQTGFGNLDGGIPSTNYGGIPAFDAGGVT
jgi:hypothetical protein